MSTDDDKIVERLEFFFSDANLRMDKFLRGVIMDSYTGGFVEIETLLKFNTIKKLSTDPAVIAAAAEKIEQLIRVVNRNLLLIYADQMDGMAKMEARSLRRLGGNPFGNDKFATRWSILSRLVRSAWVQTFWQMPGMTTL